MWDHRDVPPGRHLGMSISIHFWLGHWLITVLPLSKVLEIQLLLPLSQGHWDAGSDELFREHRDHLPTSASTPRPHSCVWAATTVGREQHITTLPTWSRGGQTLTVRPFLRRWLILRAVSLFRGIPREF